MHLYIPFSSYFHKTKFLFPWQIICSMSDPASSTWVVSSTATSGTMTYSQATAAGGGGGGVPVSTFNTSVGTVTYSQATATSGGGVTASTFNMTSITKQPHKEDKCRG